jgi:hypothetical protein
MWNLTWSLVFLIVLLLLTLVMMVIAIYSGVNPDKNVKVNCSTGNFSSSLYYADKKMSTSDAARNTIINAPGIEINPEGTEITFNTTAKMSYGDTNLTYLFTDISRIYQNNSDLVLSRDNDVVDPSITDLKLTLNVDYIKTVFNNYYISADTDYTGSTLLSDGVRYVVSNAIDDNGDVVTLSGDIVYVESVTISPDKYNWPGIICRNLYSKMRDNNIVSATISLTGGDVIIVANTVATL